MNARSVRIASRTSCTTCARTAAAVLPRGRSGRPHNGVLASAPTHNGHRTRASISNMTRTIYQRIRRRFGIFLRTSGDGFDMNCPRRHCEPTGRREAPPDDRLREAIHSDTKTGLLPPSLKSCGGQVVARASRNVGGGNGIIPPAKSSLRPRQSRRDSRRPGTSRASKANRRLRETFACRHRAAPAARCHSS
jgi:hypothetical protein